MSISRTIHQCWIGPKPIPEREARWCAEMKRMNPDFKVTLHGNELLERFGRDPYVAEMVSRGSPMAFICDRIRVLLLKEEGGIWIDPDAQPIRPFNRISHWLDSSHFCFSFRSPLRQKVALHRGVTMFDNTFLASEPNGKMINRLMEIWKVAQPEQDGHANGIQIMQYYSPDIATMLPWDLFYALTPTPNTIVLHDNANLGSWVPDAKNRRILSNA